MLVWFLGDKAKDWAWVVIILAVIFIITFVSNGTNLTDGLDGLAAGTSAIIGMTLGILAYVSGNAIYFGLPQYYVSAQHRRTCGIYQCFYRSTGGISLV